MWLYMNREVNESDIEGQYGFVYIIENLLTQKKYIGKKLLLNKKTKVLKGKKKRYLVESDWKEYWGSNKVLQEDIKTHGEDNFKRTILKFCESRGECNYWEAKYQFDNNCLDGEEWYNEWIMVRVHRSHLKKKTNGRKKERATEII